MSKWCSIWFAEFQDEFSSNLWLVDNVRVISNWLTNQRVSLKTLSSQNQTESEYRTSFQFNGKEGICSETCEKFLTRSRRNAAPATAKKERFYHSLGQSEFNDQVDQSDAQI